MIFSGSATVYSTKEELQTFLKSKMGLIGRSGECQEERFKLETGQEFILHCSEEETKGQQSEVFKMYEMFVQRKLCSLEDRMEA